MYCMSVGAFCWLLIYIEAASPTVGSVSPGQGGPRELVEREMRWSKPVHNVSLWSLLQFLPHGLGLESLPGCPWLRDYKV